MVIDFLIVERNFDAFDLERQLIEEAFIDGVLTCLTCTSTLSTGVNLPAKRYSGSLNEIFVLSNLFL